MLIWDPDLLNLVANLATLGCLKWVHASLLSLLYRNPEMLLGLHFGQPGRILWFCWDIIKKLPCIKRSQVIRSFTAVPSGLVFPFLFSVSAAADLIAIIKV